MNRDAKGPSGGPFDSLVLTVQPSLSLGTVWSAAHKGANAVRPQSFGELLTSEDAPTLEAEQVTQLGEGSAVVDQHAVDGS